MQNMQAESNFFYYADVFVNLIEPIAESGDEKTLIEFCDQLYDYFAGYQNAYPRSNFTSEIKKLLPKTKPKTVENYELFIKDLKKIPPNYLQWGKRERQALKLAENTIINIKKQKNQRNMVHVGFRRSTNQNQITREHFEYLQKKRTRTENKPNKISQSNHNYNKNVMNKNENYEKTNKKNTNQYQIAQKRFEYVGEKRPRTNDQPKNELKSNNNYNNKTIKGLPNIYLSCYLNTALQALFHDKQFIKTVLNSSCSGPYAEKKLLIKLIFQHLNGTEELPRKELEACYNQIGHRKYVTSTSDEWRQKIKSWFEDEYPTKNEITTTCSPNEVAELGGLSGDILVVLDRNIERYENLPNQINIEVPRNDHKHKSQTDVHQGVILKRDTTNINPSEKMEFKNNSYQLTFATVHHEQGKHYLSYVKKGNTWTELNDSRVSTCDWNDIKNDIGKNCTFLRYEKIV